MDKQQVIEKLKHSGITPTEQRVEIAQVLFARPQHLSAEQVLASVNRENVLVSKATVYNTLGLFARQGLVREVIVDPSKVFYDSTTSSHFHFFNVDTGELSDVEDESFQLSKLPQMPAGTECAGVDVIFRIRNS